MAPETPERTNAPADPAPQEALIALPTGGLLAVALLCPLAVGVVVALAALAIEPSAWTGAPLGAAACAVGLAAGSLALAPWRPRPKGRWPMHLLAGQGIALMALLFAALLLYSATRPDAVAFLAAAVGPFPIAMIAQATLIAAPRLGQPSPNGQAAERTST